MDDFETTAWRPSARAIEEVAQSPAATAEKPFPGYLPYSASKAGLVAITRGLARGLAPEVRVNAIAPGIAEWPEDFPEDQKQPLLDRTLLKRAGTPQDIAGAAAYLTMAPYVTGVILPVDGGLRLG